MDRNKGLASQCGRFTLEDIGSPVGLTARLEAWRNTESLHEDISLLVFPTAPFRLVNTDILKGRSALKTLKMKALRPFGLVITAGYLSSLNKTRQHGSITISRDSCGVQLNSKIYFLFDVFPTVHHSIGYFLEPTLMHTSI